MLWIFNESESYLKMKFQGFTKEIDGDNTIGNVFGGKLAAYIDSNIPKLSRYVISKGKTI